MKTKLVSACAVLATASLLVTATGVAAAEDATVGSYIVVLRDSANADFVAAEHRDRLQVDVQQVYRHALNGYVATIPASRLSFLNADPRVESVSTNHRRVTLTQTVPAVQPPQTPSNENRRIAADASSTRSGDGSGEVGVNIAVVDTAIVPDHPDLNVVGEVNCLSESGPMRRDHGTLVAGVIAARDNAIGEVGVAPGAPLWSVAVIGHDHSSFDSQLICGLDWVISTRTDGIPGNDIAVANLSVQLLHSVADDNNCGRSNDDPVHRAVCSMAAAGVTPVAAAGNGVEDIQNLSPATYGEVLTVTAMADNDGEPGGRGRLNCVGKIRAPNPDDQFAWFSNFATAPLDRVHTVAAPGMCVETTFFGDDYTAGAQGTSFAAPFAAGTVALCIHSGACAGLKPAAIIQKIVREARIHNMTHPDYGFLGDQLHPVPGTLGRDYGFLLNAGLY